MEPTIRNTTEVRSALKLYRELSGLQWKEIERRSNLTQRQITHLEQRAQKFSLPMIRTLCQVYNQSSFHLLNDMNPVIDSIKSDDERINCILRCLDYFFPTTDSPIAL